MNAEPYDDPLRRQRMRFQEAEGDVLRFEIWTGPGGNVPPHFHPAQTERFEVLEGELEFHVGGEKTVAGPGAELEVPPRVVHAFYNRGETEAYMRAEIEPPGTQREFLEEAAELARRGLYTRSGMPKGLKATLVMAEFLDRHADNTVPTFPPQAIQRAVLGPLARFARRRGISPRTP